MYRGYDIVLVERTHLRIFNVFWYLFSGRDKIEKRWGFLNEEDAIGYAKGRIDERLAQLEQLWRLKHVSDKSTE